MLAGRFAETQPDKAAAVMGSGERITFKELTDRSARLAQLFAKRGLRPGDVVAILAENQIRWFELYWAAMRSGLYLTAVNWRFSANEAAHVINDSGAKAIVTTAALAELAVALTDRIPACTAARLVIDGPVEGYERYEEAIAAQPAEPLPSQPRGDVMLYSSGTTGSPKGIQRPLSGVQLDDPTAQPYGVAKMLAGMDRDGVYLCPAPMYHAAVCTWAASVQELGATVVLMEKFDAERFLDLIERERVTVTQVVPTMMIRLLRLDERVRERYDLSSLRMLVHAAAPCPPEVKRRMIDWLGPIVTEYYSGTEGAGMTYISSPEWLAHPGSVGRAVVGVPHICDDEGKELPAGEIGLVYFERDEPAFRYHGDPEKTRQSRHPMHENWSGLGDVGYLDEDGYLYLTDRSSFTIISGGVNVYPAEVEACLAVHPKVADVAVFGLPHPELVEYVHAVVQPEAGVEPSPALAEELRAYAREHLAAFKVPRVIDFRASLPRADNGKLYKKELRDGLVSARTVF